MGVLAPGVQASDNTELEDLICSKPWPCHEALRVAFCESRMDPRAYNQHNRGLFQVNEIHVAKVPNRDLDLLYEPEVNIQVAYMIWLAQGWGPWGCKP